MTERIDHVARATELGNLATENWNQGLSATAAAQMAGAQAHAILALAEQKRIENLIMLAGWLSDAGKESVSIVLDDLRVGVAGEVWEGLGL